MNNDVADRIEFLEKRLLEYSTHAQNKSSPFLSDKHSIKVQAELRIINDELKSLRAQR